jgi:hypothetical protein
MNIGWIMPFLGCALWAQGAASQDGEVGNGCADLNRRVIDKATMKARVAEMIDKGQRRSANGVIIPEMLGEQVHKDGGLNYFAYPAGRRDPDRPIITRWPKPPTLS